MVKSVKFSKKQTPYFSRDLRTFITDFFTKKAIFKGILTLKKLCYDECVKGKEPTFGKK